MAVATLLSAAEDFAMVKAKAEQGNADAQIQLGVMYGAGSGIRRDIQEAAKWYRKAADQGNAVAQSMLALIYSLGEGVAKDDNQAATWALKAAKQGNAMGQCSYGWACETGQGVQKNIEKALGWYRLAADQGNADAKQALARLTSANAANGGTESGKESGTPTLAMAGLPVIKLNEAPLLKSPRSVPGVSEPLKTKSSPEIVPYIKEDPNRPDADSIESDLITNGGKTDRINFLNIQTLIRGRYLWRFNGEDGRPPATPLNLNADAEYFDLVRQYLDAPMEETLFVQNKISDGLYSVRSTLFPQLLAVLKLSSGEFLSTGKIRILVCNRGLIDAENNNGFPIRVSLLEEAPGPSCYEIGKTLIIKQKEVRKLMRYQSQEQCKVILDRMLGYIHAENDERKGFSSARIALMNEVGFIFVLYDSLYLGQTASRK